MSQDLCLNGSINDKSNGNNNNAGNSGGKNNNTTTTNTNKNKCVWKNFDDNNDQNSFYSKGIEKINFMGRTLSEAAENALEFLRNSFKDLKN